MKRLLQILSVAVLSTGFMVTAAAADVLPDCNGNISNTGSGSDNNVNCTESSNVYVQCVNNIYVVDQNSQGTNTGDVLVTGNTSGGNGSSGSGSNSNSTNVSVGASCGTPPATTTTTTTTPPATTPPQVLGTQTVAPAVTPQVVAPVGGVHAGGGGGVKTDSAKVTGLVSSIAVVTAGASMFARRRALGL
jgi:hypothetical protein